MIQLDELLGRVEKGESLKRNELIQMLSYQPDSRESFEIMAEANRISKGLTGGKAEVHAQLALNVGPCACNCKFCSFARINGVFGEEKRVGPGKAVDCALEFEKEGANAILLMTTGGYPFELFLDMTHEVRQRLRAETTLVANVGDRTLKEAERIRDAGVTGVYHALRLREGKDTGLSPDARKRSIRNFQEAGLSVGTCVEPVGPEHTNEELADMILYTESLGPAFSGAARRIPIPGTEMAGRGMISELRMAQIVAVTRLGIPRTVLGNCTHEPCSLGGVAGANLFWAEMGANPRDTMEKTEEGRGLSVAGCRNLFSESGWRVWEGPSRYYMKMGAGS
jgi:biotin synthase